MSKTSIYDLQPILIHYCHLVDNSNKYVCDYSCTPPVEFVSQYN